MGPEKLISLGKIESKADRDLISRAYKAAETAHAGHKRFSGEPYFNHVYHTAETLAELGTGAAAIVAGLLHDTLEDHLIEEVDLKKQFGAEVVFLVKGVTKLGKLHYRGVERHAESLRKLFIATAEDLRVLIIRLADRLHNTQTLSGHSSPEKRKRIALETLEIFAPIANRLAMGKLRGDLEDAAFPYAYPKEYAQVMGFLKEKTKTGQEYLEKVRRSLQKELAKQNIKTITSDYRIKRKWSLYLKLKKNDMDIEKIHDIVALRVVVPTLEDCYRVLGIVHGMWTPLPGRIKDYIALPKQNGYQSIHTTIFTGDGGIAEIQIRTPEMHAHAEFGIASHLSYKEKIRPGEETPWIREILEWQKHVRESGEFVENLKTTFFKNRVFTFTPDGDVIDLPEGSTVVDFAYAIHTDIGNRMWGAKVGSKLVSLDTKLRNGEIVEVLTKKTAKPSTKWLAYAHTALARKKISSVLEESAPKQKIKLRPLKSKSSSRNTSRHR